MGIREIALGINDERLSPGDHVAYFWQTEREFSEGVKFIEVGLRGRDHCVLFGYEEANEKVCGVLGRRGFDVDRLQAAGRLTILGGEADAELMLSNIGASFSAALERGAKLIRLLGNNGWGVRTGRARRTSSRSRRRSWVRRTSSRASPCACPM